MKRLQGYKFRLKPTPLQQEQLARFAGCARFVWNKALSIQEEEYKITQNKIPYKELSKQLTAWRKTEETSFLSQPPRELIQSSLQNLEIAYTNFFKKRARLPKFKARGQDSFRVYSFKLDEKRSRIKLPKMEWINYYKSRSVEGTPRQVTVSYRMGKWFFSVITEREVEEPVHPSTKEAALHMGVLRFLTLSTGEMIQPLNPYKKHEKKIKSIQKGLSRKIKGSSNWKKHKKKLQKIHCKISDTRADFQHKLSSMLAKNFSTLVLEELETKSRTASAKGTIENPGKNVFIKSRFNKAMLDQGWSTFQSQLMYKEKWAGGKIIKVPLQNNSRTCYKCGCVEASNRKNQFEFQCTSCGYKEDADFNAAQNILAAGHVVLACGEIGAVKTAQ